MTTNTQNGVAHAQTSDSKHEEMNHSLMTLTETIAHLKASSTIFYAMRLINEINQLNGYPIIGSYHIAKIKQHFKKKGDWNKRIHNAISNNPEVEITIIKKRSSRNIRKEMTKGYMELLSNQVNKNT